MAVKLSVFAKLALCACPHSAESRSQQEFPQRHLAIWLLIEWAQITNLKLLHLAGTL